MTQSWQHWSLKLCVTGWLGMGGAIAGILSPVSAQVQADPTLGTLVNGSATIPCGASTCNITGGTPAGVNLFHSLSQINRENRQIANFQLIPSNTENILVRITGGTSNINGTIQVENNGLNPNLFLMNPQGIIFGPNASLNVPGSFVATTANAVQLGSSFFSAVPVLGENPALLTVRPNALWFNQTAQQPRQSIEVRSLLAVNENRSLLLVGGNIAPTETSTGGILVDGGTLSAPGGRVELVGIGGEGRVAFSADMEPTLVFPTQLPSVNIRLTNGAEVNVQAGGGGNIRVYARSLDIEGGSFLRGGVASPGSPTSIAGDIQIDATETITITGIRNATNPNLESPSAIANIIDPTAEGQGGNIHIRTPNLRVNNGGQIFASSFGKGAPGSIFIQADDIRLAGEQATASGSPNRFITSAIQSRVEFSAEHINPTGGIVHIDTKFLSATQGAFISTSTDGKGNAGTVTIEAANGIVLFDGKGSDGVASGAYSQVLSGAMGDAGAVTISTRELVLQNGAQVSAQTNGNGNAGGLILPVDLLTVRSGALVTARTFNDNNAGSLIVRARVITVAGQGSAIDLDTRSGGARGGDAGILDINTQRLVVQNGGKVTAKTFGGGFGGEMLLVASESITVDGAGSTLRFDTSGSGDAIGITLRTGQLFVQNQGEVTVSGQGLGSPGDLDITADSIFMTSGGKLTAFTQSQTGGNIIIKLQPKGILQMFDGSKILTSALEAGDGGTITISAPDGFIISNGRTKDNDVLASAIQGRGGRIQASASGIFNFILSDIPTPLSDFTAGSELGVPGVRILDIQDEQPEEALPIDLSDPQVAQGCRALRAGTDESKFIVTNRGGLPTNPKETLSSDGVEVGLVTRSPQTENRSEVESSIQLSHAASESIVEAQDWIVEKDGTVALVAQANNTPTHLAQPQVDCVEAQ